MGKSNLTLNPRTFWCGRGSPKVGGSLKVKINAKVGRDLVKMVEERFRT